MKKRWVAFFALAGVVMLSSAGRADLVRESFAGPVKSLKGWTVVGVWSSAKTGRPDIAPTCAAIDGCGYAESPRVTVTPGGRYLVSGWGKTEDDWQNSSCIKIRWFDKSRKPIWWEFVRRDSFSKDWQKYQKVAIAPKNAAFASVVCHAQGTWGKRSFFTGISLNLAKASSILWDMHFDHKDYGDWMNDRSVYRNDGKSYALSMDDMAVTQAGGAIEFNNRKAKVRFPQCEAFNYGDYDEWVMVMQFFLQEPVAPIDEVPESVGYHLIGAPWNFAVSYNKNKDSKELQATFYRYNPDGTTTHPFLKFPIEPWKWYRLTIIVNNKAKRIDGRLLVDGAETRESAHGIPDGSFQPPPYFFVGCMDYPRGGGTPYPWGFWGKMDYIKIYDSIAAYKADEKNLVFGGFGKL